MAAPIRPSTPPPPADETSNAQTNNPDSQATAGASEKPPGPQVIQRRFRQQTEFFTDLFKLTVSKMLQWKGWQKQTQNAPVDKSGNLNPDWFLTEHCHYFHTVDSNGKHLEYSQPVAGHVHKMKVVRDPANPAEIIRVECVSGPLVWTITEEFGKREKILMPDKHDKHIHGVEYLKSDKLSAPNMNTEAAKVAGMVQAHQTSKDVVDPSTGQRLEKLAVR